MTKTGTGSYHQEGSGGTLRTFLWGIPIHGQFPAMAIKHRREVSWQGIPTISGQNWKV